MSHAHLLQWGSGRLGGFTVIGISIVLPQGGFKAARPAPTSHFLLVLGTDLRLGHASRLSSLPASALSVQDGAFVE